MEEEEAPAGGEEAAGPRKRKRGVRSEEEGGGAEEDEHEKLGLLLLKDDDDEEEVCYAEEAVTEMMMWLEADISDDDASAGFVTINGNEESCGPSFSCAASTVMATVDTRAGAPPRPPVPWPFPAPHFPAAERKKQQESETADDAAWLDGLLLACGPDGV
jgi:hypothetical protein